ncbi:MAG: HAD-IA family hydrolase, partial [Deltaproteobacteria bacterium]|nr:HAD-IA family hydrolase [Deltaproteobacteria bacterium]
TLIDSSLDIAWSANETLKAFGYPPKDFDAIVESIGWGVKTLLEKLMPGESPDVISRARERFLEFYGGHLTVDTAVYPGVRETVEHLSALGKKMAVVTNKPEGLARRVLRDLALDGYFLMVLGGDSMPERKPDPAPLLRVVRELGADASRTVMVGDSPIDCETGQKAGVRTIAVSYGFRSREELEQAGCFGIIGSFSELKEMIV